MFDRVRNTAEKVAGIPYWDHFLSGFRFGRKNDIFHIGTCICLGLDLAGKMTYSILGPVTDWV